MIETSFVDCSKILSWSTEAGATVSIESAERRRLLPFVRHNPARSLEVCIDVSNGNQQCAIAHMWPSDIAQIIAWTW